MGEARALPMPVVAVIGACVPGRSIAYAAALGGFRTILEDLLPNALRKAEDEIRGMLDSVAGADAQAVMRRLEFAGSVEDAAREADFVIEAVPDDLESKIEIFTLLDKVCRPHTILVSTTSTSSITEIAAVTYRPEKCLGMRFAGQAHAAKLLEVVVTPQTSEGTIQAAVDLGRRMGKEVRVIAESATFSS